MAEKHQFLYRIQPTRPDMLATGPTASEEEIVGEHFNYLKALNEAGTVLMAGRTTNTDPSSFGIVILMAESEEEANEIMSADPAVAKGVMQSALFPFRIALDRQPT